MDVFSHGLWGFAAVKTLNKKPSSKGLGFWAVVLGVLPDVISFLPVQVYFLWNRISFSESLFFPQPQHWVFKFAIESYNFTHSLVVFLALTILVYVFRKGKFWLPLTAWGLHILMDIPTHPYFFPTPFLFPISDFNIKGYGVSWASFEILLLNWVTLLLVLGLIWYKNRRSETILK